MNRLISFLLCCLPTLAIASSAGNRYLFIVDTSSAMRQFKHEGRQLVFDLIFSGCHDQMHDGDTFGIWTFNREVFAGVFPMQVWQPAKGLDLANSAAFFLKEQNYQKSARLSQVFAQVLPLINNVKDVQILIVTSGESELAATNVIRDFWLDWQNKAEAARKAKSPLVIALGARNGKIATWSFAIGDEPIGLPKPPAPIVAAPSPGATNTHENSQLPTVAAAKALVPPQSDAAVQPAAPPKPPEKPAPAPIIIQGKRPAPTNSAPTPPPSTNLPSVPKDKLPEERQSESEAAAAHAPIIQTALPKSLGDNQPLPERSSGHPPLPAGEGKGEGETRVAHPTVPSVKTNLPVPAIVQASNSHTDSHTEQLAPPMEQSPALPTIAAAPPPTPPKRPWLLWGGGVFWGGGVLLAGAGGVVFRYFLRPRRRTSFITQSMNRES